MADNLEFLKSERFTTEMAYFIPLSHLLISLGHFNAINILVYLKVSSVQCWNMHAMLLHCEFCSHIFFYFLFFCEWLCICKPSLPSRSLCLHFWCAVWFHLGMALFFFFSPSVKQPSIFFSSSHRQSWNCGGESHALPRCRQREMHANQLQILPRPRHCYQRHPPCYCLCKCHGR